MSNTKKINALIRGIATRGVGFREAVQTCAVLIVQEVKDNGNCDQALPLAAAIPMASDRVKLIQWFALVSPVRITFTADVKKRRVGLAKVGSKGYNPVNLDRAKSTLYWTIGKNDDEQTEEAFSTAELSTMILRLAKRASKEAEERGVVQNEAANFNAKIEALKAAAVAVAA